MATFEQALDKAFEIAWQRSLEVDRIRETKGASPDDITDALLVEGTEQTFIGTLDVLGSLLLLAGRIDAFEISPGVDGDGTLAGPAEGWIDGSSAVLGVLMKWAHDGGKVDDAEYKTWLSLYGPDRKKITQ